MKVVVADRNLAPHRDIFERALPEGSQVTWLESATAAGATDALAEAEVIVTSVLSATTIAAMPALKLVHVAGAGVDGIAHSALPPQVLVANTYHHEMSIAEYVLASLIMMRRRFIAQDQELRAGTWSSPVYDPAQPQPRTVQDATVTFLGFGHIGAAAWGMIRHLGARGIAITGTGRINAPEHGLHWAGTGERLVEALVESDVLVVSIPLTADTQALVSARELSALGAEGVVVNVARGPVIDEQALFSALQSGEIAGAALDVWYQYPTEGTRAEPASLPFHTLQNVLMTPHSSGITTATFGHRAIEIAQNINRLAVGQEPQNMVSFHA